MEIAPTAMPSLPPLCLPPASRRHSGSKEHPRGKATRCVFSWFGWARQGALEEKRGNRLNEQPPDLLAVRTSFAAVRELAKERF
ncbi:MAG: hypothetical protein M2R45_03877 [Verrucomicrobia subdivision 3 bacterium]|nr:hypothetical protein [Limisphaerales bacterium]MCS1412581.1 hypothetical protein [Limisphaerales bacterium]